jgi:hypothetical protein
VIRVSRTLTRELSTVDYRTRKPMVIQLVEGGRLLRIKAKGARQWYTVPFEAIWHLGAQRRRAARGEGSQAESKGIQAEELIRRPSVSPGQRGCTLV